MKDALNEALARRKEKAMKIEIIINGKPQDDEAEKTSGLAPEVKDRNEEDLKGVVAQDAIEMPEEDEEHEDEAQDAKIMRALLEQAPEKQGRASVSLDEKARDMMRAKMESKMKGKA
jgi:hypothetical protein